MTNKTYEVTHSVRPSLDEMDPALVSKDCQLTPALPSMAQETWTLNGIIHRENGPAIIVKDNNGHVWLQEWYHQGQLHRSDGPARIVDTPSDNGHNHPSVFRQFFHHGKEHRDLGPSCYEVCGETGMILTEHWKRNGEFHRVGGPAEVRVDPDTGIVYEERWYQNGQRHRIDGPASIGRSVDTEPEIYLTWYQFDVCHREDGPASITIHSETGEMLEEPQYYIRGNRVHPQSGLSSQFDPGIR